MHTTAAFEGLVCRDCDGTVDPSQATHRCPECGGPLDPSYDLDRIDANRATIEGLSGDSMWRYEAFLPFPRSEAVSLDEGGTPLIDCPSLATELGVERVMIKDEGRNPTGTFKDRGHSVAVTAARAHGATDVTLVTAGNAGHSAATYAARAGLDAHVFLPSRSGFTQKAMVNVHGAEMSVVEGRFSEAAATFADAQADNDWYSTASFETPYRHEGKKTMFYEMIEQLEWTVPDAIVYPTGGGVGLIGIYKAALEWQALNLIDDLPPLYAAQSNGCAPIVEAWEAGADRHDPWPAPDTICGGIEIPDPGASDWILEAIRTTGGGAVATDDRDILDAAVTINQSTGVELGATAGAAASGASALADRGTFTPNDTVVILNTGWGSKDADILRSHLMSQGV